MKKVSALWCLLFCITVSQAQLLSWTPDFAIDGSSTNIVVTMDASYGNKGLYNQTPVTDVYVHIGVITTKSTSPTNWQYSKFTWGTTTAAAQCSSLGSNKWSYTITGGVRTFFNITDPNEKVKKIAILFRSANGNSVQRNTNGADMYIPVYDNGLYARIDVPLRQPLYTPLPEPILKTVGDALSITAKSSIAGTLKVFLNGTELGTTSQTTLTANTTIATSGDQQLIAEAKTATATSRDTMNFVVLPANTVAALPGGVKDGINYEQGDTSAILVLYAPNKKNILLIGDFNNWAPSAKYQMNITPDLNRYWIRLTGLVAGKEYAYQYLIDGSLNVADYNAEKILDPDNDKYISAATYPGLILYPAGKTSGMVSVLQTKKPAYTWQVASFKRPDKRNLLIYELLVRDFVAAQNWQTVKDSIAYLKRLGVNAIEVMPLNEFEGNNSWGYNSIFYFAPDKAYGTETALKQFIDECHRQGIAVIMDIALNHSFGQSPMVQMYWDGTKPAINSPWFNPVAKHAFNVGYDMNHESPATQEFVNRVINHWLVNYKIDGFRWDLSKGFTQTQTCDNNGANCNVGSWNSYDQSRVDIWKKYNGYMQAAASGSYCILEHLGDNPEEKILADNGMMPWGKMTTAYNQTTMGFTTDSDLGYGFYKNRGWVNPYLVTYMESHDEERLQYKNSRFGNNTNGSYNVRLLTNGLKRDAMAAALFLVQPGPKMIWQFGELGYDNSIFRCPDGTVPEPYGAIGADRCKTDPKPILWGYYQNAERKALYDVYSKLMRLRNYPAYLSTFTDAITNDDNMGGLVKWFSASTDNLRILAVGNMDINAQTATVTFPAAGTWYNYLTGGTINLSSQSYTFTLQPGEYYVYTDRDANTALPLNWLSFKAEKTADKKVLLKWSTSDEINTKNFEIQRSSNGQNFNTIAAFDAKQSGGPVNFYEYTDGTPFRSTSYYRIKQSDKDGKASFSAIAKISFENGNILWQIYPNPATNKASIRIEKDMHNVRISLADLSGKIVYNRQQQSVLPGQEITIPVNTFTKGMYLLKIISDEGTVTEKLMIK